MQILVPFDLYLTIFVCLIFEETGNMRRSAFSMQLHQTHERILMRCFSNDIEGNLKENEEKKHTKERMNFL